MTGYKREMSFKISFDLRKRYYLIAQRICLTRSKIGGTACADSEGVDRGSGAPLKNHKNIRFLSDTGPDPSKIKKTTKPALNVGPSSARQRNAI